MEEPELDTDYYLIETRNPETGRWRSSSQASSRKEARQKAEELWPKVDTRVIWAIDGEEGDWRSRIWENGDWIDNDNRYPYDNNNFEWPERPEMSKSDTMWLIGCFLGLIVVVAIVILLKFRH